MSVLVVSRSRRRFDKQPWIQRKKRGVFGVIKVVELKTKPLSGRTGTHYSTVTGSKTNRGPLGVLLRSSAEAQRMHMSGFKLCDDPSAETK